MVGLFFLVAVVLFGKCFPLHNCNSYLRVGYERERTMPNAQAHVSISKIK